MDSKYSITKSLSQKQGGNGHILNSFTANGRSPATKEAFKGLTKKDKHVITPSKNLKEQKSNSPKKKVKEMLIDLKQTRQTLPAYKCQQSLLQEVKKRETLLIMGETGSGKTTQIPQMLLDAGYAEHGMIGVTQPRRVAAITVAKRVAQERSCELGSTVGYTVRFENCTTPQTRICYLTDGILLREALTDRLLRNYAVIVLDEVHERTINTDVLFGIVKQAQHLRKRSLMRLLKVIVMSATMDVDHFGRYFGVGALFMEGRTHNVRVMHVKKSQPDYLNAVLETLFKIERETPIDHGVLIFLTGQEEIEAMALQIRRLSKAKNVQGLSNVCVYPLYAQLPQHKQLDCFRAAPHDKRKIILATNIAETSLTIPGIRCVIDCGFAKHRIYSASSKLDVLRIMRISQAQAWQRCGRAGRDAPGICYRTFTLEEMNALPNMPVPEILRSNITSVVLQLLVLGIDVRTFEFLDAPSAQSIESALRKLLTLAAINSTSELRLTKLGRQMTLFPLDPQYAKLLLQAPAHDCLQEMLSLVALLSTENVFINSYEHREQAALAHAKFIAKEGDHLTLLNVYNAFEQIEKPKTWCHENYLNTRNLTYARDVRKQLADIADRLNLQLSSCGKNLDAVRKCLLSAFFENVAQLQRDNAYMTLTGRLRAKLHPSSVFHGRYKPPLLIYNEVVLTESNYLRLVTEIDAEWLQEYSIKYK